ncbi:secretory-abundant heat soluble protein 64681-like [Paramacrobiotus metropolitanus]|uniref:secretory-abundant heat soluble protein 64681-like n=1 Tax=Paramacrobiotus metropolitanus TaxID=2943436 RepID=UPI002445B8CD|nr:secretory-abundant heat soluble protein 64681-like [Paramacrobiotus metropolitanus]
MSYLAVIILGLAAFVVADHHEAHGNDPKEIAPDPEHPWIGKWESIDGRQENFDNLVAKLDAPQYGGNQKVYHKLWKEGDHFHHGLAVPDKQLKKFVQFKFGEEQSLTFNNTEFKITYSEKDKDLHVDVKIPAKGVTIHDVYHVEGEELVKSYTVGDVKAKKWFKKAVSKPANA